MNPPPGMKLARLGNSDLELSRLGFGAWAIGGQWQYGWGSQDDELSIKTIHAALDTGINWIDTAPVYGLGHSEEVIGRAISGMQSKPYVFTKCCFRWDHTGDITPSLAAESVRQEVEASLQRLQLDVIDLYQIHWPQPLEQIEEGWETLAALKQEGKIRWIGVSNFSVEQIQLMEKIAPVSSLQPNYNLIHREVETDILPYCLKQGIGTIVYSPMASGLLSGKMTRERIHQLADDDWRRSNPDFQGPELDRNLAIAQRCLEVGNAVGGSAAEIAIAWTLQHPAVTGAICGLRNPEQVEGIKRASGFDLSSFDFPHPLDS